MIRRPPRSTLDRSSAASDVYKRQEQVLGDRERADREQLLFHYAALPAAWTSCHLSKPVSYTHLRAHETVLDLVCRLLLEKKTTPTTDNPLTPSYVMTLVRILY